MDMRWSLNELYNSFESEEFKRDMEKLYNQIDNLKEWTEANFNSKENAVKKTEEYIKRLSEFVTLFSKLASFASLTASVDAKNEQALKISDRLSIKYSELTKAFVSYQKWIGSIENLDELFASSELLKDHEFIIAEAANNAKYLLGEKEEIIISKMRNTGSTAWSNLQNMITSTLLVDIELNGEKRQLPLPAIRNLAFEKNPVTRKTAYYAELESYKKIEESSAACLNGIKGEVITTSGLRGYTSPLEETLFKSRMDKETLDAMLSAMKESLPAFRKYFRKKAELLGHSNGLPFYDMFAPMGEVNITFTYEEAKNYIVKNFKSFSDELADFADNAFEKNWIDAEPREGKRGGAFCSNLRSIQESRIMANFNGSFSNMTTLAHELGHGYHGHCLKNESILNCSYPMPLAETASIFCETIVVNAALKEASQEEAFGILESSISDAGQVIVDILSRYIFETNLFEKRRDSALSVKELKELMINAQKEAYGDGLDHGYLHPYMWINKTHYYSAGRNFYNFPYAFGLLFAKGIYAEYLKRGNDFVPEYNKLLVATGRNSIADVTKMIGIDVHSIDFWRSSLKLVEQDIERFIELADAIK
ncbi:M3 family oligoendopeptidase [Proteiniborus sp. MB09-C3]|uniref:M3 family oligoendopeptidase n=1 Tax=Proteiniborus sp. MB09-C3 TaxID=3050072 RepID=UPI00255661F2|nr:M3 family oligoendopeptidase [Proteiniborus sp. MB09-C3]WIV11750.1 M3 family oligoendopeptidase [Proteiniborus sp. MB09-C3]